MNFTKSHWYAVGAVVECDDMRVPDIATFDPDALGQGHLPRDRREIDANADLAATAPYMLGLLARVLAEGVDDTSRQQIAALVARFDVGADDVPWLMCELAEVGDMDATC